MAFRILLFITLILISKFVFASGFFESGLSANYEFESVNYVLLTESIALTSNISFIDNHEYDPSYGCDSYSWWCDITFGLKNAEERGVNGILISGYAYHPVAGWHWPTGYTEGEGNKLNEFTPGLGYSRTFYNPVYNTEYILYAMAFVDSYYKPELHVGYTYQQYFDLNDKGNMKWGIGYSPFIFVKSSMIGDTPVPLPGAAIVTSLKYDKFNLMLTYFSVFFVNVRIDM